MRHKVKKHPETGDPHSVCITPTTSDSRKASSKYFEVPGCGQFGKRGEHHQEMAVVGPVMSWAELPQRLAMMVGTMDAYNPTWIGKPVTRARPWTGAPPPPPRSDRPPGLRACGDRGSSASRRRKARVLQKRIARWDRPFSPLWERHPAVSGNSENHVPSRLPRKPPGVHADATATLRRWSMAVNPRKTAGRRRPELHFFSSKRPRYSPYPSCSRRSLGMNLSAAEFMQYRRPVGGGPSGKRWPRCESANRLRTSMRTMA